MFGIRYIKVPPSTYILVYRGGKVVKEGVGLSFFYYAPTTSLVVVPVASTDVPFIFQETSSDFQEVTIQGQVTYRIADPKRVAGLLNYTLDRRGINYVSTDPEKLSQRVMNMINVLTHKELQQLPMREALRASDLLVRSVTEGLRASAESAALGLEILGISILAIRPVPETARALEAEAREKLLREADEAISSRRNAAVEQERSIKENELNTEIAVETKKRQIREAQLDAEKMVQERQHQLREAETAFVTAQEEKRQELVRLATLNSKAESDAKAYGVAALVKAVSDTDPRVLQALATSGMKPQQLIALAFQGLAEKAEKIGTLNISPELLRELLESKK